MKSRILAGLGKQKFGDETMVFDERSNRVHVLNATSAFVWQCLEEGCDDETIASRLAATFDTGGKDTSDVVARTLALLREKGLLDESGATSRE